MIITQYLYYHAIIIKGVELVLLKILNYQCNVKKMAFLKNICDFRGRGESRGGPTMIMRYSNTPILVVRARLKDMKHPYISIWQCLVGSVSIKTSVCLNFVCLQRLGSKVIKFCFSPPIIINGVFWVAGTSNSCFEIMQ